MWKTARFFLLLLIAIPLSAHSYEDTMREGLTPGFHTSIKTAEIRAAENLLDEAERNLLTLRTDQSIQEFSWVLDQGTDLPLEISCRALFGRALALAVEGDEDSALNDLMYLSEYLDSFSCEGCSQEHTVHGDPILGPNEISIQECLRRVEGVEMSALTIAASLPLKLGLKSVVITSIATLTYKAKNCCRQGGVWKACLKPLLEKWKILQIWDNVGIPPDPYWD